MNEPTTNERTTNEATMNEAPFRPLGWGVWRRLLRRRRRRFPQALNPRPEATMHPHADETDMWSDVQRLDGVIHRAALDRLRGEPAVAGRDLALAVEDGVVTVRGEVATAADRQAVVILLAGLDGVASVADEMTVSTGTG